MTDDDLRRAFERIASHAPAEPRPAHARQLGAAMKGRGAGTWITRLGRRRWFMAVGVVAAVAVAAPIAVALRPDGESSRLDIVDDPTVRSSTTLPGEDDAGILVVVPSTTVPVPTTAVPTTAAPTTTVPATTTTTIPFAPCSAGPLRDLVAEQPGLPAAVAAKRMAILKAATACDYEALAALGTTEPGQFTFSFGGSEGAASHWRDLESRGYEPMRYLVTLLAGSFTRCDYCMRPEEEVGSYAWPRAAVSREGWLNTPLADIDALRPLYDDEDFAQFEGFGFYIGYRIFIRADGEWLTFVNGD